MERQVTQFRVRRKSDGMFFGCRTWGQSHSSVGKFYATLARAKAAYMQSYPDPKEIKDHELVEYHMEEVDAMPLAEYIEVTK